MNAPLASMNLYNPTNAQANTAPTNGTINNPLILPGLHAGSKNAPMARAAPYALSMAIAPASGPLLNGKPDAGQATKDVSLKGLTNHIALMYRAIVPANRPMAFDGNDSNQADAGPFVAAEHHPDVAPSINTSADEGKREAETDGAAAPVKREK